VESKEAMHVLGVGIPLPLAQPADAVFLDLIKDDNNDMDLADFGDDEGMGVTDEQWLLIVASDSLPQDTDCR
jgi:hypothetical protein